MNLQQYICRRNFPYNNTIKEDSDEHLSENRSVATFTSGIITKHKQLINKMGQGEIDYIDIKQEFVNMKSDNNIKQYQNSQFTNSEKSSPNVTQEFKAFSQRYMSNKLSPMSLYNENTKEVII